MRRRYRESECGTYSRIIEYETCGSVDRNCSRISGCIRGLTTVKLDCIEFRLSASRSDMFSNDDQQSSGRLPVERMGHYVEG